MKKRAFLEKALKKFGFTDDQVKDFIEKLEEEYSDDDAAKALASLMTADEAKGNDEIFKDVKKRTKGEALGAIDALLKQYEPKLTAEQKTEYAKFGATDTDKKYQFILKAFADADTKTGDKNYDDLKTDFDNLKTSLANEYIKKADHDIVAGQLTAREKELLGVQILNHAIRSGRLKDVSSDRHFERNFITDAEELLSTGIGEKKVKGFIDATTGKVMRTDSPEQPLLVDNKPVLISDLANLTITAYGYEKKSDQTPQNTVQVPAGPQSQKGSNAALAQMLAEEAAAK